ncbi:endonuclease/exonuclease/phosphatase family protein [Kribbella deserti]|uniref:Endonuclease/exonuclease/phosphatase family protein n=1 Tax=Kribbella deserti TaxID=1926257 RepID=A0ABV6QHH2_9ACTN
MVRVCGLQEVWDDGERNLVGWLADELGYHWAFAPSPAPETWQRRNGEWGTAFGNAVLSRWPISEQAVTDLSGDDGRTLLFARIDSPGGRLPFFTTHLTSTVGGSPARCAQVRQVCEVIAVNSPAGGYPAVLTGDLNAEPDSDELRLLGGHKTAPPVPGLVLIDAWRYADAGDPGFPWQRRNPYVAATLEPDARVDYVHVGLPAGGGVGHVESVRLVGDEPVDDVWASDHSAVLVELADRRD